MTPTSVTVWLALRKPGWVTLKVLDINGNRVMDGKRHTVAIGYNLHIVAVTAKQAPPGAELTEGIVYRYDLVFDFDDNLSTNLATATANANISYPPFTLPSLALPPKDLNSLRLLQGSCRMPHAKGKDTLPIVDDLLAQSASNAFARPHQLFLTGDQIYADDVADILSLLLADAGYALLKWSEEYILPPDMPSAMKDLHPELRLNLLKEVGFTSEDLRCHLMGLGEYMSMYLFVWSDVLWPSLPDTLPTFDELDAAFEAEIYSIDMEIFGGMVGLEESRRDAIKSQTAALQEFRLTLFKVRRALANIPSYMIFDDHEVTDDWNMTRDICRRVYGAPLGLRIVQNALIAYALCQHWGNAPEQFAETTPTPPGLDLLRLLDTPNPTVPNAFDQKAANLDQHSKEIRALLGLHDDSDLKGRPHAGLFHDSHSLQYHYHVEGPGHQVIITDTRTWRSFPHGSTELLPKDQFKRQILDTPDLDTPETNRVLLVVLSTNTPPVPPIRSATQHASLANTAAHYPDIYEAWDLPTVPFDRLLATLTEKLPLDFSGQRYGPVILLSGDVHHSFASRLIYRAKARFEDQQPQPATAVFAQLVASSFKKQTNDTIGFHREGYRYAATGIKRLIQGLIPEYLTEGYVGWNVPAGSVLDVGMQLKSPARGPGGGTGRILGFKNPDKPTNKPTTVKITKSFARTDLSTELSVAPHYRYRLDYLLPIQTQVQLDAPPMPPMPAGATPAQRKQAAAAFHAATARFRMYNIKAQPKVVGVNNFGEITFVWSAGPDKKVNHTLRWWKSGSSDVALTTYTMSLNPNDPNYKDLRAEVEPP